MEDNPSLKQHLRQTLRLHRVQLSPEKKEISSQSLLSIINKIPQYLEGQYFAAYWPHGGEISPIPILLQAHAQGKTCYLPKLEMEPTPKLTFIEYEPDDPLLPNRYGIFEPQLEDRPSIAAADLDIVLTPLVAFDETGHRLGMGVGYYDRTFSFLLDNQRPSKPFLLGLAYDWQCVDNLPKDSWDIPLNGIVTDKRYIAIAT